MIQETGVRLPCLLDRLVDHAPEAREESVRRRTIALDEYRAAVLRDLRWLMNSPAHLPSEDICEFPHVAKSVLNYGTRDLAGATTDNLDSMELERQYREAIIAFEPRIVPETLQVRMILSDHTEVGRVGFEIKGHLWALPHPERIFFRTDIDLETGICEINSSGA
jgi:type VI secretion system protein ImpF